MTITDLELKTLVQSEIHDAIGFVESEITEDRGEALKRYFQEPYGDEQPGLSSFVSSDVSDVIEGCIPPLMKIFTASDDIVEVTPQSEEDVPYAEQARDWLNYVFYRQNPGFMILQTAFRDALLSKLGVFKSWWDDAEVSTPEDYQGLTETQLLMLADDPEIEILSQSERPDPDAPELPVVDELGEPVMGEDGLIAMQPQGLLYDVECRRTTNTGQIRIEAIPPEEFLISKRATSLEDCNFVCHQTLLTVSDLIEAGYDPDIVKDLPTGADLLFEEERLNRFGSGEVPTADSKDPSMREITVQEAYIKCDYDESGIATWRKVTMAGDTLLDNEEVDSLPFSVICPISVPHRFYGRSIADLVMPTQRLTSVLTRQLLDNSYLSLNQRLVVQEGQANLQDLMANRAGGIIRVKSPGAVQPLPVPNIIGGVFPLLEYFRAERDNRTVGQDAAGIDPNILQNSTATAIAAMQSAAMSKLELIARNFAEQGVRDLFRRLLQLSCQHETRPKIIRLRNEFVEMSPSNWNSGMDLRIAVGLGTNSQDQAMAMLGMILAKQEQILTTVGPDNPLVGVEQYRNTLQKLVELAGFKNTSDFIKEGGDMPAQQQEPKGPSPEEQKIAADIELAKAKMEADIALEREKMQQQLQLEREKVQMEMELRTQELQAEYNLKSIKTAQDINESDIRSVV